VANIPHRESQIPGSMGNAGFEGCVAGRNTEGVIKGIEKGIKIALKRAGKQQGFCP